MSIIKKCLKRDIYLQKKTRNYWWSEIKIIEWWWNIKKSQQNNSETVTNKNNQEIPKERYISPEEIQKIIDNFDINIIV